MAQVFLGQIMMTGFGFAPRNFALCNGQLLSIQQNAALFSLLGTYYGGDGQVNFALPNMQGRTPVGFGTSVDPTWAPAAYPIGTQGGAEGVALNEAQLPLHAHLGTGTLTNGNLRNPSNALFGTNSAAIYGTPGAQVPLAATTVAPAGGGQQHTNMQPYDVINFCISLSGVFPSRN